MDRCRIQPRNKTNASVWPYQAHRQVDRQTYLEDPCTFLLGTGEQPAATSWNAGRTSLQKLSLYQPKTHHRRYPPSYRHYAFRAGTFGESAKDPLQTRPSFLWRQSIHLIQQERNEASELPYVSKQSWAPLAARATRMEAEGEAQASTDARSREILRKEATSFYESEHCSVLERYGQAME